MLKTFNLGFGLVFLILGISGWAADHHGQDLLFGAFRVDPAHNTLHLLVGLIASVTGLISERTAKMFFRGIGILLSAVAAVSFVFGDRFIFGIVANNTADSWLYAILAGACLLLGFVVRDSSMPQLGSETQ